MREVVFGCSERCEAIRTRKRRIALLVLLGGNSESISSKAKPQMSTIYCIFSAYFLMYDHPLHGSSAPILGHPVYKDINTNKIMENCIYRLFYFNEKFWQICAKAVLNSKLVVNFGYIERGWSVHVRICRVLNNFEEYETSK